jgi:transglutaminase-like putative cysteine protease
MLHVKLRNIELREPLTVSLRYTVTAHNREIDADQASKAVFRDYGSSIPNEYLKPETLVESENKEIMDAARRIFGGELPAKDRSVYKSARKIYDWVLAHASYKLNSEMRRAGKLWGALDLLHGGKGECGDFAALFIALCRRAGIASRPQVGFWTRTDNQMHVWAEFYVPHHGWVPVDPSMGKSDPNRYFGNIPDIVDRVVVSEAFDHMYLDKKYDLLQTYYYWYTYSGTPVKLTAKGVFSARRIK